MKVTRNYQVTIPKEIRERLNLKIGDALMVRLDGNKIVLEQLKPVVNDSAEHLSSLSNEPSNIDAVKLVEDSWHND